MKLKNLLFSITLIYGVNLISAALSDNMTDSSGDEEQLDENYEVIHEDTLLSNLRKELDDAVDKMVKNANEAFEHRRELLEANKKFNLERHAHDKTKETLSETQAAVIALNGIKSRLEQELEAERDAHELSKASLEELQKRTNKTIEKFCAILEGMYNSNRNSINIKKLLSAARLEFEKKVDKIINEAKAA